LTISVKIYYNALVQLEYNGGKMDVTIEKIELRGDRILVKQLKYDEKVGSFYVPESVRSRKEKRRADAWKAEVIKLGDSVDFDMLKGTLEKGDVIYCAPVSLDCPAFETNTDKYIIITDEDVLAKDLK
jgi:co-chaperonin GroES (HSP10)